MEKLIELPTRQEQMEGIKMGKVDFPSDYGVLDVPFTVWALSRINCKEDHKWVNLKLCWEGSEDCSICKGCGHISHD